MSHHLGHRGRLRERFLSSPETPPDYELLELLLGYVILRSPQEVAAMARKRLGRLPHEEVWAAYVDNKNRLLSWERASKGTINTSTIYPREIMERALRLKAAGVIMVHNHPSGDSTASGADLDITRKLQQAANSLNIRLLDHVIVTENGCRSLMEEGMI